MSAKKSTKKPEEPTESTETTEETTSDIELKGKFDGWIFGCDICQDVCPWNLKSEPHDEGSFEPHPKLLELNSEEWQNMERPLFNELFKNSAVKRTGFKGIKRNLDFLKP